MSHFLNIALSLFHRLFPVVPFAGEDKTNISLDSRKGLISSAGFQKKFHPLPWMDGWSLWCHWRVEWGWSFCPQGWWARFWPVLGLKLLLDRNKYTLFLQVITRHEVATNSSAFQLLLITNHVGTELMILLSRKIHFSNTFSLLMMMIVFPCKGVDRHEPLIFLTRWNSLF